MHRIGGFVASGMGILLFLIGLTTFYLKDWQISKELNKKKGELNSNEIIENFKTFNKNLEVILCEASDLSRNNQKEYRCQDLDKKCFADPMANLIKRATDLAKEASDLAEKKDKFVRDIKRLADSRIISPGLIIIAFGVLLLIIGAFKW